MRMSQYRSFAFGRSAYAERSGFGVTDKQNACLAFLTQRISETGVAPSVEEIRKHLGLSSKSPAHRLLAALEARGKIRRMAHRARAIEVVGMSAPASPPAYPQKLPVLDTSEGYKFFTVSKDGPEADAKLVECGVSASV